MKKSQILQFILNVLFGPLGLFYSSMAAGVVFTLIAVGLSVGLFGVGWFLVYPFVLVFGFITVARHNRGARAEERRHREVVDAAREGRITRDR